jgi:DNA-binding CsgD family transcriptional regulator
MKTYKKTGKMGLFGTGLDPYREDMFNIADFSSMLSETASVIDFQKRNFRFVADHSFSLCGYSPEEIMSLGYDFYSQVVHPDDMPLLAKMYKAVLKRVYRGNLPLKDINYFSCTFRMRIYPQLSSNSDYVMVYQKLKPLTTDGQLNGLGLCFLSSSVMKESGNLRLYYKENSHFDAYSAESGKWKKQKIEPLSDRQRLILLYSKGGDSAQEIADLLSISIKTLETGKTNIFKKLGVKTIQQAIVLSTNQRLLFFTSNATPEFPKKEETKPPKHKLTPDILKRIQTGLDNKQSVRSLAKSERFSEKALRKAIQVGKLTKNLD